MKTEKLKGASTMKESKYAGTQTEKNLMAAFAGESEGDTNPEDYSLTSQWYSAQSGQFSATRVFGVYEDLLGNEWLLSDNGLGMLTAGQTLSLIHILKWAKQLTKKEAAQYDDLSYIYKMCSDWKPAK